MAIVTSGTRISLSTKLRTQVLYVGWLTVANVVTAAYVLERLNWSGWGVGDVAWTVIMLVVASAIGLFARFAWRDPIYGGVFVWAFVGVAVKEGQPFVVVVAASLLAFMFLLSFVPGTRSLMRIGFSVNPPVVRRAVHPTKGNEL